MPDTAPSFLPLTTDDQLEAAVTRSQEEPVVLYKHSTTCSISARAQHRLGGLDGTPPVYRLVVQEARGLSQRISERFGIRHESPQVLVLYRGVVVDHASHGRVAPRFVTETVERATAA